MKIFGGGVLMGAAALVADGCNITQGLTNSATLSLGSLVAFVSMAAGAWRTLWALYLRKGLSSALAQKHHRYRLARRDRRVAGHNGQAISLGHGA